MKHQIKQLLITVLICIFASGILLTNPVSIFASEQEATELQDTQNFISIEEQIRAFAKSIEQKGADDSAAMVLAMHGMTGGGRQLNLDESAALTAVLFNSEVLQTGLAYIFADTIESMQRLDMQEVPGLGLGFGWYGKETAYSSYIFTGSDEYPDNLDWMQTNGIYTGPLNDYDKSLEWMVGGCEGHADIKCIKDTGSRKTYGLSVTVSDRFDFSIANTSGFKQLLSGIGMLLFREFEWSCTVNFEITTAYSYDHCSHGSGAYRWTYDADIFAMNSDDSEDFIRNNTTHKINMNAKGEAFHYYELDKTVRLYHDKPWVLEYDTVRPKRIAFAPVENAQAKTYPLISQSSNQHLYIVSKEYAMALGQNGSEDRYYAYDYYGTKLLKPYDYNYNKPHTFRLENIISGDGSNMIYLTVVNIETGNICIDKVPLDDHYYYGGWMDATEMLSEESDWVSGKDIHINYLGNMITGFEAESFELRIWENGKEGGSGDYLAEKTVAPSCTGQGSTVYTCSRCGYSHQDEFVPALGHELSDWNTAKASTCTENGEECRNCSRCDYIEKREISADGHDYESVAVAPTCTQQGYTSYSCSKCGHSYTDTYIDAIGHLWDDWNTWKEPSSSEEGEIRRYCHCGAYESETIAVLVNPFEDVRHDSYYFDSVLWAAWKEITAGVDAEHFGPGNPCTRAQIVTFLWRAMGQPEQDIEYKPFSDVEDTAYYFNAVLWAAENGITTGTAEGKFSPEQPCTRAQVLTFLWRAMGEPKAVDTRHPFGDVNTTAYYYDAVLWAVDSRITAGYSAESFAPDMECTRAQVVTFLYRLLHSSP